MASPDLRIVIVSWNVEEHLRRCLASLPAACEGIDWDVVVVDNASADDSVAVAEKAGALVMANPGNRGFATACNQGMAGSSARYMLLLNPDTECPPSTLADLVRAADEHPNAGIIGPKLLNADGSTQASVRRFPTLWNQIGILLKLHHLFPWLFRRYFATDLAPDAEQNVDQVMGACFLMRREYVEQIGGLDERYFIWFEEVDACRAAHKNGWSVRYIPEVSVIHHGGQSFGQLRSLKKQRYFNTSLAAYFQKWHPGAPSMVIRMLNPLSLTLAWLVEKMPYTGWIAAILATELISRLTIFHDTANGITTILAGLLVATITFKRPTIGLAILALELLIGSHGRLLQLWGWPGVVSLRMMLFAAFFVGWGAQAFWKVGILRILKDRWEWVLAAMAIIYGIAMGVIQHNPALVADANAWIYALLLIPVVHLARTHKERLKKDVLPVLILGPLWLAAKAIGIEYLFAHGLAVVDPPTDFYLWIRRTGVGEVTPLTSTIHRVFMQSQVFALPALLLCTSYYFATHEKEFSLKRNRLMEWVLTAAIIALLIGYSRSLWIGAAAGLTTLIAFNLKQIVHILRTAVRGAIHLVVAIAILTIAVVIPFPSAANLDDADGLTNRISTTDAAAASRWDLLNAMEGAIKQHPLTGYGLGATITYQSSDPRVLAANPTGTYTTFAFEWGWLDHWFKLGLFGLLAILLLIIRLALRIVHTHAEPWMKHAALASLMALAVTHFFTPYLNHPLGLGYLIALEGWLTLQKH